MVTRFPVPGVAKTRLIPALGAERAAALHRRLVEMTMAVVRASGLPAEMRVTGAPAADFARWLGDDLMIVDQGDGDLGARLARVPAPCLLIGADCPDLQPGHLQAAAAALHDHPAVLGPAADGGYWLLGLAAPLPGVFEGIDWGSDLVATQTLARLPAGIPQLPVLADCDRPEDLARWPWLLA
ncbi:TIGR04282 family arsenosugar biosynthesis glycosyltransferase [Polymorphobacter sp.]|uniref:TIGR04282 family arsenosugar biosynthesis glycosyltransferase n=1 Tax=Polymorphobacter sp. TaxID=1909290 RepID=UPI003F7143C8